MFVPSEGTEQWASTWALVRVLSADVIQCVHSCIQVRTLTFITELFISIYARHVWTWRTLLGLLLLSLLISCYICSLSKQKKKTTTDRQQLDLVLGIHFHTFRLLFSVFLWRNKALVRILLLQYFQWCVQRNKNKSKIHKNGMHWH